MHARSRTGGHVFAYFTAAGLLLFGYHYFGCLANGEAISPLAPFVDEVLTGAWMAAVLFPFVARFARRHPITRATWLTRVPLHLGAVAAYSAAHTSLLWMSRTTLYPLFGLGGYDYGLMSARYPMEFFHDVLAYVIIVSILYLFDRHVRAAHLETTLAQARLQNLQLQLRPHFLFNALNTISSVVYENPRRADTMIAALSDLLRTTLADADEQLVSLEREMEMLDGYLAIMRARFEGQLNVAVQVEPDVRHALVPHLLLQPLVENSIKHGVDPRSNGIRVLLRAERDGRHTRLSVRDYGGGLPGGPLRTGTGIANTAERLRVLYGADHRFALQNCADGGLSVTVAIPYRTS
jgi:two-component system, LytTR family, sensor kinase